VNLLILVSGPGPGARPRYINWGGILPNLISSFNLAIIGLCEECVNFKLVTPGSRNREVDLRKPLYIKQ
jgi:hypothetical protein